MLGAGSLLSCALPKSGHVSSSCLLPALTRSATVLEPQRTSLQPAFRGSTRSGLHAKLRQGLLLRYVQKRQNMQDAQHSLLC